MYNHLHGLHWNTGEFAMKDLIEYLILTIKRGKNKTNSLLYMLKDMIKSDG